MVYEWWRLETPPQENKAAAAAVDKKAAHIMVPLLNMGARRYRTHIHKAKSCMHTWLICLAVLTGGVVHARSQMVSTSAARPQSCGTRTRS